MGWPRGGVARCKHHGGAAPQVLAKAAERQLEAQARAMLPESFEPVANPVVKLLEVAAEMEAFKDNIRGLVGDLDSIRYEDAKGAEQLRSEVAVYERALVNLANVLVKINGLGLLDKQIELNAKVEAARLAILRTAQDGILRDLGHDPRDPQVALIVGTRLEAAGL